MSVGMKLRRNVVRENILNASRKIILEQGYNKLSMRAIAREAGFSPASLYEYFKNKGEILEALAEFVSRPLNKSLKSAVQKDQSNPLLSITMAYIDFARNKKEDFCLIFSRGVIEKRKGSKALALPVYRIITDYVEKEMANGKLASSNPAEAETIAYSLMAFAHGLAALNMVGVAGKHNRRGADRKAVEQYLASLQAVSI